MHVCPTSALCEESEQVFREQSHKTRWQYFCGVVVYRHGHQPQLDGTGMVYIQVKSETS